MTEIHGGCHCGNIRFDLQWPGDTDQLTARQCGCSFCTMRGGTWTSNPDAVLQAQVRDVEMVSIYRFGTKTADFHVCSVCGVVPFVTSEIDGDLYAVVNVAAFENISLGSIDVAPSDFEGEEIADRLQRRKRNWIGSVLIS